MTASQAADSRDLGILLMRVRELVAVILLYWFLVALLRP